jgi:hypothetical protein
MTDTTTANSSSEAPSGAAALFPADTAPAAVVSTEAPAVEASVDSAPAEATAAEPAAKPPIDPASYEIKIPEGFAENKELLDAFKGTLAEAGFPADKAQALFDLGTKQVEAAVAAFAESNAKAFNEMVTKWGDEIKSDPEIGGSRSAEVQTTLGRALDEYGSKEARSAFELTGAGNNPAIVKMIYKMAQALSEGSIKPGISPGPRRAATPASALYPDTVN